MLRKGWSCWRHCCRNMIVCLETDFAHDVWHHQCNKHIVQRMPQPETLTTSGFKWHMIHPKYSNHQLGGGCYHRLVIIYDCDQLLMCIIIRYYWVSTEVTMSLCGKTVNSAYFTLSQEVTSDISTIVVIVHMSNETCQLWYTNLHYSFYLAIVNCVYLHVCVCVCVCMLMH